MALLRRSPILFINLLLWTQVFADFNPDGTKVPTKLRDRPFITWPCQDRELATLHNCSMTGKHRWCVKSREMGWTWLETAFDLWMFVTQPGSKVAVASRKEDQVYKPGNPDAIFSKYEYNLKRLPSWLIPSGYTMTSLLLNNPANNATIVGESTNTEVGRSGRSDRTWTDESAAIDNLQSIENSLIDNSNSHSHISTPRAGSYFNRLASSPLYTPCRMMWYEHPGKGQGRKAVVGKNGRVTITSPWKAIQDRTRSRRNVAEEIEGDLGGSGDLVFDPMMLEEHARLHARPPINTGDLFFANRRDADGRSTNATIEPEELYEGDDALTRRERKRIRFESNDRGAWKLWCDLERQPDGLLRPPQWAMYVIGADPGDGRMSANSAIAVWDAMTGEQVASFVSARHSSRDFARIVCASALWFGGKRTPLVIWETNGVGGSVTEMLAQRLSCPGLYRRKVLGRIDVPVTDGLGWSSTAPKKRLMLDGLADKLTAGVMITRDVQILDEARTFIIGDGGWVSQATLADLGTGARESHGDLTVAAALCAIGIEELPNQRDDDRDKLSASRNMLTWYGREAARQKAERNAKQPRWAEKRTA